MTYFEGVVTSKGKTLFSLVKMLGMFDSPASGKLRRLEVAIADLEGQLIPWCFHIIVG